MKNSMLLKKEFLLGGNNISTLMWILCAIFMQFIPHYPLYVGPFYITLCIMLTFGLNQTSHDILYTVLLPVRKIDTVKSRFLYCGIMEGGCVALSLILGIVRVLVHFPQNDAGINLTLSYLGFQLVVFSVFNLIFLGNVYKNPVKPGFHYLLGCIGYAAGYVLFELPVWLYKAYVSGLRESGLEPEGIKEALAELSWYMPQRIGCFVTQTDFSGQIKQLPVFIVGVLIFAFSWIPAFRCGARQFEKYDM